MQEDLFRELCRVNQAEDQQNVFFLTLLYGRAHKFASSL